MSVIVGMSLHVKEVCKIGQEARCCKYLLGGAKGFECGKVIPAAKLYLDQRTDMVAKGDNCDGKEGSI